MIWSSATAIAGSAVDQHRRRDQRVRNLFFWGSLDFETERESTVPITAHPWLLSVTEGFALPPKKGGCMSNIQKFNLREWLVPPILLPIFLGLLIAGAVIIRW